MQVVNPKLKKEVQVDDAKFSIGIIPFGKRTEIQSKAYFDGKAESGDELKLVLEQGYEFVRWGVKGHSGLTFEDGSEVPFVMDEKEGCVSAETMAVYAATPTLLVKLSSEVANFNFLKKETVKN